MVNVAIVLMIGREGSNLNKQVQERKCCKIKKALRHGIESKNQPLFMRIWKAMRTRYPFW